MNNPIADYIDPTAICLQIDAADGNSVLELLGHRLHASGIVRRAFVDSLARERSRPVGIRLDAEVNIALARVDPEHVIRPGLALATLAKPVLFRSMSDPCELMPVRLVFVMAANEQGAQRRTLRRIAGLVQGRHTVDNLLVAASVAFVTASICNCRDAPLAAGDWPTRLVV